ncbi:oxidoreductase [Halodesulfurarchaeum formicicum]|uniref:Short-chain dehydrogenase/reductase SDR n=1 Tax=Halodesulfurarchaeum formicicum TaxID=1873524 RepID=A0A1J1ACB0_9EURY|nr:oxidoreductase [Halodesulfurarchaeum formicicum]APE95788.1 short-chain dehydrogenase/reductase SDR [Halodesulfurarchaeum formicicum]
MSANGWTDADLPDLSGRTAIVTGANSGIGYELTRMLAEAGAHVVMATRSVKRGQAAARDLRGELEGELSVRRCDLADLDSVRAFTSDFIRDFERLDVLFNNAGVMAIPRSETADGFETQFGVNHLGHFALTGLLFERLRETPGESRVLTQSSGFHQRGRIDFDDLQSEASYDKWDAYAQSKLANVLFAYELDRRVDRAGIEGLTSVATHPGYADTNLQRRGPEQAGSQLRLWLMKAANALFAQSPRKGAWPMLYAATAEELTGGEYVGPTGLFNMRGPPGVQSSSDRSSDETLAKRLWDVSEGLTGIDFEIE